MSAGVGRRFAGVLLAISMVVVGAVSARPGDAGAAVDGSRFVAVTPQRILDSRSGQGPADDGVVGVVASGEVVDVQATGRMGVPLSGVTAVVLNVTITEALGAGFVQVFPTGVGTVGSSSNLNVEYSGQTIANQVTVPVGAGGKVSLFVQGGGHVLADVFGYYTPVTDATAGRYVPVAAPSPRRVLDTRDLLAVPVPNPGDAVNCTDFGTWDAAWRYFWTYQRWNDPAGLDGDRDGIPCNSLPGTKTTSPPVDLFKLAAGGTIRIPVVTGTSLPGGITGAGQASAVVANITVTEASGIGFWQVLPTGGAALGSSSNLNINNVGQTISNQVIVPVGADGAITIYSQSGGHVLVDIAGTFTGSASPTSAAGLFVPVTPSRLADTRDPLNTPVTGPIPTGGQVTVQTANRFGIPAGAAAVALNATITDARAAGFVQVFPTGGATPGASSNINAERAGQTIPNAAYATLDATGRFTMYTQAGGQLIADVAGWFTNELGSAGPVPPPPPPPPTPPVIPAPPPAPTTPPTVGPLQVSVVGSGRVIINAPISDPCADATWTITGPTSYVRSVASPDNCFAGPHSFDTARNNGIWLLNPGSYTVTLTLATTGGQTSSSTTFTMPFASPPAVGPLTVQVFGSGRAYIEALSSDRCATATWTVTGPTSYTRTVAAPPGCWGTAHSFDTSWAPQWLLAPGLHTVTLTLSNASGTTSTTTTLTMPAHIVTVAKSGGAFTTVTAALNAISDASTANPYLIRIGSGTFVEPTIYLKSGVHFQGSGQQITTIVAPIVAGQPSPWNETPWQEIRSLTVVGNIGISYRIVHLDQVTTRGQISVFAKSNGGSLQLSNSEVYTSTGSGISVNFGGATVRYSSITAPTPLEAPYYFGTAIRAYDSVLSGTMIPEGPASLSCIASLIRPGVWQGQTFIPTGPYSPTSTRCTPTG